MTCAGRNRTRQCCRLRTPSEVFFRRSCGARLQRLAALRRGVSDRDLHHIKASTPQGLRSLARVTDKIVVLEPNGNHLLRKLLELTPNYRSAGEDSFRTREMVDIFSASGWRTMVRKRLNLFPNFTPGPVYRLLAPLEPYIEESPLLNALCTVNMFGAVRQ